MKNAPAALLVSCVCMLAACGDQRLVVGDVEDAAPQDAQVPFPLPDSGTLPLDAGATDNTALTVALYDGTGPVGATIVGECQPGCVDVEAIAAGGHPPYSFRWQDGVTGARRSICDRNVSYEVTVTDSGNPDDEFVQPTSARSTVQLQAGPCPIDLDDAGTVVPQGCREVSIQWCTGTIHSRVSADLQGTVLTPGKPYELRIDVTATGRGRFTVSSALLRCDKDQELFAAMFDNPGLTMEDVNRPFVHKMCLVPTTETRQLTFEWARDLLVTGSGGTSGGLLCEGCASTP